jgi:hypothetical protein
MGRTACTEPQCLYSRAIPLLPQWAVRTVQSLNACTRVHFTFYFILFNNKMLIFLQYIFVIHFNCDKIILKYFRFRCTLCVEPKHIKFHLYWKFMGPCIKNVPIYIQQDATLHSLFIFGNCSTCFGWYFHPSPGGHTNVSTASGICHTVTVICRYQLELVWVCCGWCTPPTAHSNRFQLFNDSGR